MNIGMNIGLSKGSGFVPSADSDPIGTALRADCKAYWKMGEASGNRLDSTGNGRHFVPVGVPTSAAGKVGNAVSFDGNVAYTEDQQYLVTPSHTDLRGGDDQDFSIAGWIYLDEDLDTPALFSKEGLNGIEYLVFMTSYKFVIEVGVNIIKTATSTVVSSMGNWYFVVAWHDSATHTAYVSVNGETPVPDERAGESGGMTYDATANVLCGASYEPDLYAFQDGLTDELGFWHRVLTADERAYLYNSGTGRTLYP